MFRQQKQPPKGRPQPIPGVMLGGTSECHTQQHILIVLARYPSLSQHTASLQLPAQQHNCPTQRQQPSRKGPRHPKPQHQQYPSQNVS